MAVKLREYVDRIGWSLVIRNDSSLHSGAIGLGMRLKNGMLQSLIVLALLPIVLQACSSRSQPAPVDTLYTGKTYRDFQPNSLNAKKYEVQKLKHFTQLLFAPIWMSMT